MSVIDGIADMRRTMLEQGATPGRVEIGREALMALADETYEAQSPRNERVSPAVWRSRALAAAKKGELFVFGIRIEYDEAASTAVTRGQ